MTITQKPNAREQLDAPRELNRYLARIGGRDIYGDANFRVVWGWSRMAWLGGKHEAQAGLRGGFIGTILEPKYIPHDRWYLESKWPAEHYGTPRTWKFSYTEKIDGQAVEVLGPYPSRGEYEFVARFQSPTGGFVGLTPTTIDRIVAVVHGNKSMRAIEKKNRIRAREDYKEKSLSDRDDAILNDISLITAPPVFIDSTKVFKRKTKEAA